MTSPDVTIVVCTFNRASLLSGALDSLSKLDFSDVCSCEVLVVDNGSSDHTPQIVIDAADRYDVPIRYCRESEPGIAAARNRGVRSSRTSWIAFFDDDQIADIGWLSGLLTVASEENARFVLGSRLLLLSDDELGRLARHCRAVLGELTEPKDRFRYEGKIGGSTGNMLVHSSVFDDIGGFNAVTIEGGEDADLFERVVTAGIDAWYTADAVVYHVVPPYRLQPAYFRWTCRRQGIHVSRAERYRWGAMGFPIAFSARFIQLCLVLVPRLFWARLARDPRAIMDAKCRVWRAEGCLRKGLGVMAPRLMKQEKFFASLEFRSEREIFSDGERNHRDQVTERGQE